MPSPTPSTRSLTALSLAGLATFPVIVVALHLVQRGHYHPLSEAVSELALGRGGWLMFVAFTASGIGTLCAAAVLRRTLARSRAVAALLAVSALGSFVSAVFHADGETGGTTTHGRIHQTAGIGTFVAVMLVMLVCNARFRRDPCWRPMAWPTLAWTVAAVGSFFLIPAVGGPYFGVAQRIFIATWFTWLFAVIAYARVRLAPATGRELQGEPRPASAA
jgi:hypothetical membrane protein